MSKIKPSIAIDHVHQMDYAMFNDHYAKMFQDALKMLNVSRSEYKENKNLEREQLLSKWDQLMPSLKGDFKPIITSTQKTNIMSEDIYAKNRKKIVEILNEKGFTINEEKSSNDFLYFSLGRYNYGLELFENEDNIRYFIDDIDNVKLEDYFYEDYDWTGDMKEFKDFLFDAMCFKWKYIKNMYDEFIALRNKYKKHPDEGVFDKMVNNVEHDDDEDDEDIPF